MTTENDWPVGAELPGKTYLLTLATLRAYAAASGDTNPVHTDPDFAASTPFGRPIAHGMLLLAHVMEMLAVAFGRDWITAGRLRVSFRKQAYVDRRVSPWGKVTKWDASTGTVHVAVGCRDEAGRELLTGSAAVSLRADQGSREVHP